ncbi:phage integrase [Vibrio owensii]|nr:hypothetical protein THZB04_10273 [Vibrio owensii]
MAEVDNKPWLGEKKDLRTLQDLVELWYKLHGQHLKSAAKVYPRLCTIVEELDNPFAIKFTAKDFVHWRSSRKAKNRYGDETTAGKSISAPTNNLDLRYLRTVFNELIALGEWTQPNPLACVRSIQVTESEMGFFSNEDITTLFDRISKSKKNRPVPITEKLYNELIEFKQTGEKDKLFKCCLHGIVYIVDKTFPDLSERQNTHVVCKSVYGSRRKHSGTRKNPWS